MPLQALQKGMLFRGFQRDAQCWGVVVWCGCQHPGTALKGVPGPILEDSRDCVRCMRVAVLGLRRGWVGRVGWGHLGHVNTSYLHEG